MTTLVEARGVLCPVPIIRLARTAAALPPGSLVELITDDPAAEHDVPAWCRLRGHELLSTEAVPTSTTGPFPDDSPGPLPDDSPGPLPDDSPGPLPDDSTEARAAHATPRSTGAGRPARAPEPHVPNPSPGQALRHLIRLRGPGVG